MCMAVGGGLGSVCSVNNPCGCGPLLLWTLYPLEVQEATRANIRSETEEKLAHLLLCLTTQGFLFHEFGWGKKCLYFSIVMIFFSN